MSEEEFREGLASNINSRLVYHDLFSDPLGWSGTEGAFGDVLGTLRAMCGKTEPGPITIALDSLSWLLLHFPCTTVCQTLHSLSHQDSSPGDHSPAKQVRVLGLLHEELHSPSLVGALSSLAQSEVTLSGRMSEALTANILCQKAGHRPLHQTQWFSILPDFTVSLQRAPSLESQPLDPHKHQVDPMSHLTFNLHLSEKEKEAKDSLVLPFHFSSEKQQALLHPGPGQATSHIFYEPDAYDDLDQEDPDDDLDV